MRKEPETLREAQKLLRKYSAMLDEAQHDAATGKRNKTALRKIKKAFDYYTEIIPKMTQDKKSYIKVSNKIRAYSHDVIEGQEPTHMVVSADGLYEMEEDNTPLFIGSKRQCQAYINSSQLITLKIKQYGGQD